LETFPIYLRKIALAAIYRENPINLNWQIKCPGMIILLSEIRLESFSLLFFGMHEDVDYFIMFLVFMLSDICLRLAFLSV
jgi:hypothetical protein